MTAREAVPRYRAFDGPSLFRQGFRPFFLGAGLWALLALALWIAMVQGALSLPSAFGPVAWHAHEMIFGYTVAVIAGFLLTAIPNWTGRMPLQGAPLAGLFATWLLGRVATALSAPLGPGLAALLDLAFLALLIAVVLREIVSGRNWRNLPMPIALGVLLTANGLTHLEVLGQAQTAEIGQRLGIATAIMMISLIGGRIIPSFTRNWLAKQSATALPAPFGPLDRVCLLLTLAALATWVALPESLLSGALLVLAGLANILRLVRWRGQDTGSEALVWSLHLGFVWVPLGLLLLGFGVLRPDLLPPTAGLHALTTGAIGAMTLAVMSRAILGHSGRPLAADGLTTTIYVLIAAAAATRVAAPLLADLTSPLIWLSSLLWIAAFGLFTIRYGRIVLST